MSNISDGLSSDLTCDFDYPSTLELGLLRTYIENIDITVEASCQNFRETEYRKHQSSCERDEYFTGQHIEYVAHEHLPNIIKKPLVITCWSQLESLCKSYIAYAHKKGAKDLSDLEKEGVIKEKNSAFIKWAKFFKHELDLDLKPIIAQRVDELNVVRNCIAHASGNVLAMHKAADQTKIFTIAKKGIGLEIDVLDTIIIHTDFLLWSLDVVESVIHPFDAAFKAKYR